MCDDCVRSSKTKLFPGVEGTQLPFTPSVEELRRFSLSGFRVQNETKMHSDTFLDLHHRGWESYASSGVFPDTVLGFLEEKRPSKMRRNWLVKQTQFQRTFSPQSTPVFSSAARQDWRAKTTLTVWGATFTRVLLKVQLCGYLYFEYFHLHFPNLEADAALSILL